MFHICSLVCFLIYGVNRRQVLIAKPRFYFSNFKFYDFYIFIIVLIAKSHFYFYNFKVYDFYKTMNNLMVFIKTIIFFNKIGPLWAHKGP